MRELLSFPKNQVYIEQNTFKSDVLSGLTNKNKKIPSKYFYDQYGSELFNQITQHPDYYLTNCELEILHNNKHDLAKQFVNKPFNLIELGPGDGSKGKILIEQFIRDELQFKYSPVDISAEYLNQIVTNLNQEMPTLKLSPMQADYFYTEKWIEANPEQSNIVLFLGSTLGNLDCASTKSFLQHLWKILFKNDYVLIGFDLCKDINVLMRAYDDSAGITREFNLNLLRRINHELGGDFNLDKFRHYATYNPHINAMESFVISQEEQSVYVESLKESFYFQAFESIQLECSCKYLQSQINYLAESNGFEVVQNFFDTRGYFVDSLWRVKKNNLFGLAQNV